MGLYMYVYLHMNVLACDSVEECITRGVNVFWGLIVRWQELGRGERNTHYQAIRRENGTQGGSQDSKSKFESLLR